MLNTEPITLASLVLLPAAAGHGGMENLPLEVGCKLLQHAYRCEEMISSVRNVGTGSTTKVCRR
jgi:hypothetical protein